MKHEETRWGRPKHCRSCNSTNIDVDELHKKWIFVCNKCGKHDFKYKPHELYIDPDKKTPAQEKWKNYSRMIVDTKVS